MCWCVFFTVGRFSIRAGRLKDFIGVFQLLPPGLLSPSPYHLPLLLWLAKGNTCEKLGDQQMFSDSADPSSPSGRLKLTKPLQVAKLERETKGLSDRLFPSATSRGSLAL